MEDILILGKANWKVDVKTYFEKHSYQKNGYCKILKMPVITFLDYIRTDPETKPKTIQEQIEQILNLMTTIGKC